RLLLQKLSASEREERIFEIVNHLNLGRHLVSDVAEKEQLLRLNLAAGKKARAAAAFPSALGYLQGALQLLAADAWSTSYELTLEAHLDAAEAAYLATDFAEMTRVVDQVEKNARTLLDKVRAFEVQIDALVAQNKLTESVDTGLEVLRLL